jgi:hypothetical protein
MTQEKAIEQAYNEIYALEIKLLEAKDAIRGLMRLVEHVNEGQCDEYKAAVKVLAR